MELRRNETINTPFILSLMAGWMTSRRRGISDFSFIKPVVTHFLVPTQKMKKYKKKYIKYSEEIQKIIGARKGC
jgi:hypothetical protein